MEPKFQLQQNGQSVVQADYGVLGDASALADDRVFAELFRIRPFDGSTVRKGILPSGYLGSTTPLVATNGASGAVLVSPFRAFVGSRTAVGSDAKANWRDVRSAIAVGATTLAQQVSFSANSSGNPRWDLVYAAVSIDGNGPSVSRYVKNPVTKAIANASVITTLVTTLVLDVVVGTPAASPVFPTIPADAGSTYYVPLAYVRIPNGFGPTTTVLNTDIAGAAPVLLLSRAVGGGTLRVADGQNTVSTTAQQTWGSTGARPKTWMPPTMVGAEALLVTIDPSLANGTVLDSRDWRGRWVRWSVSAQGNAAAGAAPDPGYVGTPYAYNALPADPNLLFAAGLAQTIRDAFTDGQARIVKLDGAHFQSTIGNGNVVTVYVDLSDGKLKLAKTGTPSSVLCAWLEFSGVYENA